MQYLLGSAGSPSPDIVQHPPPPPFFMIIAFHRRVSLLAIEADSRILIVCSGTFTAHPQQDLLSSQALTGPFYRLRTVREKRGPLNSNSSKRDIRGSMATWGEWHFSERDDDS